MTQGVKYGDLDFNSTNLAFDIDKMVEIFLLCQMCKFSLYLLAQATFLSIVDMGNSTCIPYSLSSDPVRLHETTDSNDVFLLDFSARCVFNQQLSYGKAPNQPMNQRSDCVYSANAAPSCRYF